MKWTAYPGDHMIHAYGQVNILSTDDPAWADQLCEVPHDIYHRPEYHELTGFAHQGTPYLFSYREDGHHLFLWPYFLRPIAGTLRAQTGCAACSRCARAFATSPSR